MAHEYFETFLADGFGPPIPGKPVPPEAFDRYRGVLPDALLDIWAEFGWAGFAGGRLWLTDPTEWAPIFDEWFHGTEPPLHDDYHVILRDAFGKFECWGPKTGVSMRVEVVTSELTIRKHHAAEIVSDGRDWELLTTFLGWQPGSFEEYRYDDERPLFEIARRVHGQLTYDEVYGFFPPVSLSGAPENSDLHRVGAIAHLAILAQTAPAQLTVHTFGNPLPTAEPHTPPASP